LTAISTQPDPAPGAHRPRAGRAPRLLRARPDDPAWARPALLALLAVTALLYIVGLSRNGWANEFYAAAAQAGTKSWKAFLFGSLDSANFITVDKPPAFLWVMELSARVFGLNYWSLLVPQALEGVATVGVLYTTVRRWFGPSAAIIAGAVMALAPVATLIFRFDDPDALLTLMMTVAAYAATRAIESGRTRWLALTGALLGLGFLAKMLAAFLVLPALALAYLCSGPPRMGMRIWQLLVGGAALLATAGWWVAIELLTPAADRPFVGSSTNNNILQLTFGYNGLSRLTGNRSGLGGGGAGRAFGRGLGVGAGQAAGHRLGASAFGGGAFGSAAFGGGTGITRLFQPEMGGQISWLIPAALIAFAAMLWLSRRAGRTDRTRAAALMWAGWLLVAGLVLSLMSGTTHSYYAIALAPAIGALVGIGSVSLWRVRHTWFARATMAAALGATAAWAWVLLGRSPGWFPWLRLVIVLAAVCAAGAILVRPALRTATAQGRTALAVVPVSLAMIVGLGGPLAYSLDTAASAYRGASPSAGPALTSPTGVLDGVRGLGRGQFPGAGAAGELAEATRGEFPGFVGGLPGGRPRRLPGGFGGLGGSGSNATVSGDFAKLLETGASRCKWAAATVGSDSAASMELATGGVPVMAIGGFRGTDPAPSLAEFEELVSQREIHYFVGTRAGGGFGKRVTSGRASGGFGSSPTAGAGGSRSAGGPHSAGGGSTDASQISAWVEAHFTAHTVGGMAVYNLTTPVASS